MDIAVVMLPELVQVVMILVLILVILFDLMNSYHRSCSKHFLIQFISYFNSILICYFCYIRFNNSNVRLFNVQNLNTISNDEINLFFPCIPIFSISKLRTRLCELYKKQPVLICSVIHYFRSKILESVPFVERSRNIPPLAVKNIGAKHS